MARIDLKAPLTLSDIFAALPGVFLLAGYGISSILAWGLYSNAVEVTHQTASYQHEQIKVPKPHAEDEQPREFYFHPVNFPVLDAEGKPILSVQTETFVGVGKPRIIQDAREILIPTIGNPPLKVTKSEEYIPPVENPYGPPVNPGIFLTKISYTPDVTYKGTGIYEVRKSVLFDVGFDRERYAVVGGALGSLISLFYFSIRILTGQKS